MKRVSFIAQAATAFLLAGAGAAAAATVDVGFSSFDRVEVSAAIAARDTFIGRGLILSEDFENGFTPCTGDNRKSCSSGTIASAAAGTFTGFGGAITNGQSQVRPKDRIVVRAGTEGTYGRYNVTPGGSAWLDSNDREGIDWNFVAPGRLTFQRVAFFLTDLDDVGQVLFSIGVNGALPEARPPSSPGGNGRLHLITLLFDTPVPSFDLRMVNGTGDGMGLDGARIAAVPVPAAVLLLASALGGLAFAARLRPAA